MAAGKCGCAGTTCSCVIKGDGVTGAGSVNNPYIITAGVEFDAISSPTITHTLLGDGSASNPWRLTSVATLLFGDLTDVDASVGTVGYVPARQADGTFAMVPPSTAPAGAISAGNSIEGDGSSGDPLDVRLDALSGLVINAGGLALTPYTVTSEGDLDTLFGALPPGALVADTDGSGAWLKTLSGWAAILQDTGIVSTIGGNVTAAANFTVNTVKLRRKNGLVQVYITVTTNIARTTSIDTANIANVAVCTVVNTDFRPSIAAPLRMISSGADHALYIGVDGVVVLTSLAQPDVTWAAGDVWNFSGTFIGA